MILTEGPIGKSMISLMLPMMGGMIALLSYSIADTWFVGQIGTMELAAVSFTFPVSFIVGAMAMGLGIGTSSVASRLFGADNLTEVQRITTHSLLLGTIFGLIITAAGLLTIEPVFLLLGADENTLPLIERYISIYYWGGAFMVLPMIGSSVMRACGDAKTPAKIMTIAAVLNVVLDPILIFGWGPIPALGIEGAAIATVISNIGTAITSFGFVYFRDRLIRFRSPDWHLIFDSWSRILHVGIPSMTSSLIAPLTTAFITYQVAQFGQEAVAGFGVASRVEGLALLAIMAISGASTPFVGQNFGAGNYLRVRQGVSWGYRFSLTYGAIVALILFISADFISGLFTDEPGAIRTAGMHMKLVPWSYGMLGISAASVSAFNAIAKPLPGMVVSMTRTIAVYAPLAFLLAAMLGLQGVFIA
ncbi:MAG: MATE family efflux transporter, partial [Gammaproteobacteria bacterium]